ncbi:nucleic acid-binding, OB-fold, replication protein A, OB domain protein [Tanacetum coccineum]
MMSVKISWSSCRKLTYLIYETLLRSSNVITSGTTWLEVAFVCSNQACGEVTDVHYKYKLQIRVLDRTSSVSLTLFDRVASKLLNRTAEEFIREMRKMGDMDHFPEHFNTLLGCTYALKVDITKYCLDNHKYVYPVATFTDDGSIIEELEAMESNEEDALSGPKESSSFGYQEDSNDTPPLKRSLEVIDVEDILDLSSKKR